ncbi:hypothetical protein ROR02_25130 [Pararhodospirillum oryzae]|uniref:Uncharacterized protein n=2 Tax=Pararhodospirillum oryzae TaxID=478448 RepID=A0A512HAB3_9PROT|nr:hypothetical protein ROR02_25130 [Pararhodospirillum oryzae]
MDPFTAARPSHGPALGSQDTVHVDLGDNRVIAVPRDLYALVVYPAPLERDAWETAAPQAFETVFDTPGIR